MNAAEANAEELRPGLVAVYRDTGKPEAIEIVRIEPAIALALRTAEAPHPRLAATSGTAHWQGYLNVLRPGVYHFSARLRGRFRLTLDGKEILAAEGNDESPVLEVGPAARLESGVHRLTADFTRRSGMARLELFWQGPQFRTEPLPFDVLGHLPVQETTKLADGQLVERGRFLAAEHSCTRCHLPADSDRIAKGLLTRTAPDLSQVGNRVYAGWLYRWLESPQKLRPRAAMLLLFSADEMGSVERYAATCYLTSLGGPLKANRKQPSAKEVRTRLTRGERLFTGLGCAACHRPEKPNEPARVAAAVQPNVPLLNLGSKTTPDKLAVYLMNPLAVDPSGRMPNMLLQEREAQDLARYLCQATDSAIAAELPAPPSKEQILAAFRRTETRTEELTTFQRLPQDAQLLDLGKRLIIEKGCNDCHTIAPGGKPFANRIANATFADIKDPKRHTAGCLAEERSQQSRSPWFAFTADDRKALRLFLRHGTSGSGSPAPAYAARAALQRFHCLACHTRDGEGGLAADLVEELRRVEKADNSEAIMPPTLTGVGHKLRTPWLKQVLLQAGRARPWMGLRMPQFGEANVGWLPGTLAALEGAEPDERVHRVALTAAKVSTGRQLVGKSAFGCISCHDIAGIANTGTRGPDLALMNQRVRYDWYQRWLEQPQRLQPGTRMPTIFPDGKSLLTEILGGNAGAQAEAMWAYLSLGLNLPLPEGLEPPQGLVLAVRDRPVLLRTFLPDVGTRAVAVGYPGGISVAFDAATCRLAYAWSGNFLDASPVWGDRGGNPAKVLGPRFWNAPQGCPWAVTTALEPPDFAARAKEPAYGARPPDGQVYQGTPRLHFDGYTVEKTGRPVFRYRLASDAAGELEVSERLAPLSNPIALGFTRFFSLRVPSRQTAWLLVAECARDPRVVDTQGSPVALELKAKGLEVPTASRLLVLPQEGDRAQVLSCSAAQGGGSWHLQRLGNTWQVLFRLRPGAEAAKTEISLKTWVLPRDELELIKECIASD